MEMGLELEKDLLAKLEGVTLRQGVQDKWIWKHDKKGCYTVKSAYNLLRSQQDTHFNSRYKFLWNGKVPLKVAAMAWKALQDRLSSQINLLRRNLIENPVKLFCVSCEQDVESSGSPSLLFGYFLENQECMLQLVGY